MSYCEDEALHFDSAIPVDRVEPELALASEPVGDEFVLVTIVEEVIVRDGWVLSTGRSWIVPPARAPPAPGSSPPHPQAVTGSRSWRPFASFRA